MTTPEKLEIKTPDGAAAAHVYRPDGGKASPAVLFFPDAGGVRASMHQMAERLSSLGYVVLLPNVLYRAGDFAPFDMKTVFGDAPERARLMGILSQFDLQAAMHDVGAYLDTVTALPGVLPGKVGAVGYCMGGRMAFASAAYHPDRIGGAACFHAGNVVTDKPDSPHLKIGDIRGKIYLGVADEDGSCSPEHQAVLARALGAAHVDYQMELYAGKRHGYAVEDMPVYDAAAAARHWERMATFFAAALPR
jgi:carboxymethylenebutenolidase